MSEAAPPPPPPPPPPPTDAAGLKAFPAPLHREVMEFATGTFLDCGDEAVAAAVVAGRFNTPITAADLHAIRIDAAREALTLKPSDTRKRLAFRFRRLTLDNLVKEYMFITRVPTFMEAKIDIADEVFWLAQNASKARLCIAFNDALGRNNVTVELLEELLDFRERLLRIKALVAQAAEESGTPLFLLDVAETARTTFFESSDVTETTGKVAELLGVKGLELTRGDVLFLCNYYEGANLPDLTDEAGFRELFETADAEQERDIFREAMAGNLPNLSRDELRLLFETLRARPLLGKTALTTMQKDVLRGLEKDSTDELLTRLGVLLDGHLAVCDVENLYTSPERFKMGLRGFPANEVALLIQRANLLSSRDDIRKLFKTAATDEGRSALVSELITRYMAKRFGQSAEMVTATGR